MSQRSLAQTQDRARGTSRRQFMGTCLAGSTLPGLSLASDRPACSRSEKSVILLLMLGGPSVQETFDPKPDAPAHIRGPFSAIASRLPGVYLSEHLPRIAHRMNRLCLVRSLYHDAAPIHETGLQYLQTGRLIRADLADTPQSVEATSDWNESHTPPFAILPSRLGLTGISVSQGQDLGALGRSDLPLAAVADVAGDGNYEAAQVRQIPVRLTDVRDEPRYLIESYGSSRFGRDCLRARRLVEAGSRLVVVNMYTTVFGTPSWDAHGKANFSTFEDYKNLVCPTFDQAFSGLVDDLQGRGLLGKTLVIAAGEFGRNPMINESGGRDHWPRAFSALLAGGSTPAGEVIGQTDRWGGEPIATPIHLSMLHSMMAEHLIGTIKR